MKREKETIHRRGFTLVELLVVKILSRNKEGQKRSDCRPEMLQSAEAVTCRPHPGHLGLLRDEGGWKRSARHPNHWQSAEAVTCRPHPGFTLVELLVVIAIIGMLVGLLLPAVQQAREAARKMQCSNTERQLALAANNHLSIINYFPSGGWQCHYVGDPEYGSGMKQPGGWFYNLLPYIEQQALHDLGTGQTGSTRQASITTRLETPIQTMYCPSRRAVKIYPHSSSYDIFANGVAVHLDNTIKLDYAACSSAEVSSGQNDHGKSTDYNSSEAVFQNANNAARSKYSGVIHAYSQTTDAEIRDGFSNTYLLGEKYVSADHYETGKFPSDNEQGYGGHNNDSYRLAWYGAVYSPMQDRAGYQSPYVSFGSAHAGGLNMAFCDGHIATIPYSVDRYVHWCFANRSDGGRYNDEFVTLSYE